VRLDVGSGDRGQSGPDYIKLDKFDFSASYPEGQFIQHDLKDPLPFEAGTIDEIWCHHVLEHLTHRHPDPAKDIDYLVWVMNEFHRVLKVGGLAHCIVPWWEHPNNWRHPTHYREFNEKSFEFWTYSQKEMPGEVASTKRNGRWKCKKNCIHDNTHIYAILIKLDEHP